MFLNARNYINKLFSGAPDPKPTPKVESIKDTPIRKADHSPEKSQSVDTAQKAAMGAADYSIWQQTKADAGRVKWAEGARDSTVPRKDGNSTYFAIDCSGWVMQTQRKMIDAVKDQLDNPQSFAKESKRLVSGDAATIIDNFAKAGAAVLTVDDLQKQAPKEGMLIGQYNPGKHANGKARNVDHIAQTVKGPDGKIYVSESSVDGGVKLTEYSKYMEYIKRNNIQLFAVDAYQHYDKITNGQFSKMAAPATHHDTAAPQAATPGSNSPPAPNTVKSLTNVVRPTELEYVEQAPPTVPDPTTLDPTTVATTPATPAEINEHQQQLSI